MLPFEEPLRPGTEIPTVGPVDEILDTVALFLFLLVISLAIFPPYWTLKILQTVSIPKL